MQLVLSGAFALGAALPQLGTFISASISAAAVFNIIEEVIYLKAGIICATLI